MIDVQKIKDDIILKDGVYYFDFTASGLGLKSVESEIGRFLQTYSNIHSEVGSCAKKTGEYYDRAHSGLKRLLGLSDEFHLLACGQGASGAIEKFLQLMGIFAPPALLAKLGGEIKATLRSKNALPLVIISPYEHHSNELCFRYGLCDLCRIRLDSDGRIDLNHLFKVLKSHQNQEIIASFSAASNLSGILSDYKKIFEMIKSYGGILALDAATISSHANLDCDYFDAIFFSPHKLLGGVGSCGLLGIKDKICKFDAPTFAGGGTVERVDRSGVKFVDDFEKKQQAGTPPITQLIRAYLAYKFRNDIGLDEIYTYENELKNRFEEGIKAIDSLEIYGSKVARKLPIYAFNIKNLDPYKLAKILSYEFGVQCRAGCMCAAPYGMDLLQISDVPQVIKPGFVRITLHYSHSNDDIDYLIEAIKQSKKIANKTCQPRF